MCGMVRVLGEQLSLADVTLATRATEGWFVAGNRGCDRKAVGDGWIEYMVRLEAHESVLKTNSMDLRRLASPDRDSPDGHPERGWRRKLWRGACLHKRQFVSKLADRTVTCCVRHPS